MAVIPFIKRDLLEALTECRSLYNHCLAPRGQHTDAGVEAAFLQMVKSWENFLEDCTLAFLCQRLRCDGLSISACAVSKSEEFARRALLQDRPFLEWTDVDRVITRWEQLFHFPGILADALRPAKSEIRQMIVVRNAIAHSSYSSQAKFRDLAQQEFGIRRRFARPAEFLATPWVKDARITYFDRYADVLETVTPLVTG